MTKREQIILALMALTVVVGGYLYFAGPSKQTVKPPAISMEEVKTLNADVAAAISKQGLSRPQEYALKIIGEHWQRDPFAVIGAKGEDAVIEETVQTEDVAFEYSAYVIAGDQFVGVINGREYQVGDSMAQDGYVLVRIDTKSALIKGPGESNMIVVPYREYVSE